jgi:hypothetical protein
MGIRVLILLSLFAITALPGWAVLGGAVDSIANDQANLQANRKVVQRQDYTVHEISRADGTMIREYVSPDGKVFGVSWTGPVIPDLSQLLGSYNTEFQNALRAKRGRRNAGMVRNSDLVVESSGHQRAFYGRAFLSSMLPGGVTQEIVK